MIQDMIYNCFASVVYAQFITTFLILRGNGTCKSSAPKEKEKKKKNKKKKESQTNQKQTTS